MTFASPASITATHEFVVPRSIPITLPIRFLLAGLRAGRIVVFANPLIMKFFLDPIPKHP
jgi:hypothetical protein